MYIGMFGSQGYQGRYVYRYVWKSRLPGTTCISVCLEVKVTRDYMYIGMFGNQGYQGFIDLDVVKICHN